MAGFGRRVRTSSRPHYHEAFFGVVCAAAAIFWIEVRSVHADDNIDAFSGFLEERDDGKRECRRHLWASHAGRRVADRQRLYREIEDFQSLVEESLVYREVTIKAAERLKLQIEQRMTLSGADLDLLNSSMSAHLRL